MRNGIIRKNSDLELRIKNSLDKIDAVISQGQFLRSEVLTLNNRYKNIYIINNGVRINYEYFKEQNYIRKEKYIFALGNHIHRKGFDLLLKAFSGLHDCKYKLVLGGEGKEFQNLKNLNDIHNRCLKYYFLR